MTNIDDDLLRKYVVLADEDDSLRRLLIRSALRAKRAKIHRANSLGPRAGAAEKLKLKRFGRSQSQKLRRALLGSSHPPMPKDMLLHKYRPNPILDAIQPKRAALWKPILSRRRDRPPQVVSISRFSFIDDPAKALACLAEIIAAESSCLDVVINFDFDYVEDIGPFLLLSEMRPHLGPVFTGGGKMAPAVQKVIEAVGLRASLGMHFPGLSDTKDVWAMPVQRRRPAGRSRSEARYLEPQKYEVVASKLCDELNRWMRASGAGAELTGPGRAHISQIVGELLDNAERHSSFIDKDGSWTVAAFMAKRTIDNETRHICHIAFLSLGDTIADSLQATAPPQLLRTVSRFVDELHDARAPQSRDTLVTLAALQDGITRDPEAFDRDSGGTGFMEFVDSVNILGLSNRPELRPKIAILSGGTCVTLKAPYIKGERKADDTGGRRIFFNPRNAADEPPEPEFVRDLPLKFPGTVISVVFTLDPEFYRTILNGTDPAERADDGSSAQP